LACGEEQGTLGSFFLNLAKDVCCLVYVMSGCIKKSALLIVPISVHKPILIASSTVFLAYSYQWEELPPKV
jgi:hypothetical protein